MLMRAFVALLLLANLLFFGWNRGWLDGVGAAGPRADHEPQRLRQQVRPEAIRVVSPEAASAAAASVAASAAARAADAASAAASAALACLEAGPFAGDAAARASRALKSLDPPVAEPVSADIPTELPGRWAVYMGRYAGPEALAKKEDELRRRHLDFAVVAAGPLAPGLALSRHDTPAAAAEALGLLGRQGVHTARVVQEIAPRTTHLLRVAAADPALAARLTALQGAPYGGGFRPCAPAPATR